MSHQVYYHRSVSKRLSLRILCGISLLGLVASACGQNDSWSTSQSAIPLDSETDFTTWCLEWQINCDTGDAKLPDTIQQNEWQSINAMIGAFVASGSNIAITSTDLADARLEDAMMRLGVGEIFAKVQGRLSDRSWNSLALRDQVVASEQLDTSFDELETGLQLSTESLMNLAWLERGRINLNGLAIGSGNQLDLLALKAISVAESGYFSLEMSDLTVNAVPASFLIDHGLRSLGIQATDFDAIDIKLPSVISAAGPLVDWMQNDSRQVRLNAGFFDVTATELRQLLADNKDLKGLDTVVDSLQRLQVVSGKSNLVEANSQRNFECSINQGDVRLKVNQDFGIKSAKALDDTTLGLEFYGLRASAKKAFGITIGLKRVELKEDKIIIRDVPLIGKVELDLNELGGGEGGSLSVDCELK